MRVAPNLRRLCLKDQQTRWKADIPGTSPDSSAEHVPVPVEWTSTFTDPRLCAAIVDRLTFDAHIIQTGTDSYRLRTTKTRPRNRGTAGPRAPPRRRRP